MPPSEKKSEFAYWFESGIAVVLVILGVLFSYYYLNRGKTSPLTVSNFVEAQSFVVIEKNREFQIFTQDTKSFEAGKWVSENHVFGQTSQEGDRVDFSVSSPQSGKMRLLAYLTRSYDYGIVQFFIDGKKMGEPIDLWSQSIVSTGPISLGELELQPGKKFVLRLQIVGKNKNAAPPFYQFGFDGISFQKI